MNKQNKINQYLNKNSFFKTGQLYKINSIKNFKNIILIMNSNFSYKKLYKFKDENEQNDYFWNNVIKEINENEIFMFLNIINIVDDDFVCKILFHNTVGIAKLFDAIRENYHRYTKL